MSNKCVIVLAPNGRRQNVKVTPNTTILQVLEEVCHKQGFKAEEYDIKHHNKVMDATSIIRYTGLPNNAQLEMAAAVRIRSETQVKVGLALENGSRVMGEFKPSDSLWHVVVTLCPDEAGKDDSSEVLPVIFYLGREECGIENLKTTTLRSLGLTSGGAILRFFKKTREELHHQANVSAPLSRPLPVKESSTKSSPSVSSSEGSLSTKEVKMEESCSSGSSIPEVTSKNCSEELDKVSTSPSVKGKTPSNNELTIEDSNSNISQSEISPVEKERAESEDMDMDYEDSSQPATQNSSIQNSSTPSQKNIVENEVDPDETIVFLGERNAVLFDVATAKVCNPEDIPDDFFDLTVDDAKQLLRDLKRRQATLAEQPLVTAQYRELEKSKLMLNALSLYKRCVMKVQFPNQLVLQGTFTPLEKVSHVTDFVKNYLQDPTIEFHIFTTPPKKVLLLEQSLYDANCVPGALVYFASSAPCPESGSYIRNDLMAQVSSASAAAAAAASFRSKNATSKLVPQKQVPMTNQATARASSSVPSKVPKPNPGPSKDSDKKVPKWFKPSK